MANSDYNGKTPSNQFTPLASLGVALDYLDHTVQLGRANFPRTDSLTVGMAALVDDEFMKVTALGPGTVAVARGTADTVPARHPANALMWFINAPVVGSDRKEYSAGETTSVKYSPYTAGGGSFPMESSDIDVVTHNWRFYRPYPPGKLLVRGQRWYEQQSLSADEPMMLVTWAHRDRTLQADQLIDHDLGDIGPEPGTSYTIRIYDDKGTLLRTEAGIMAQTRDRWGTPIPAAWTYSWRQAMQDFGFDQATQGSMVKVGKLTLFSTRDGFDSWQGYEINFDLDTQGQFIRVAQAAEQAAQAPTAADEGEYPPQTGVFAGQVAVQAAQAPTAADVGDVVAVDGMYVGSLHEGAGQETSFYTPMNRNLFEAPYAFLLKIGRSLAPRLVTVTARPNDRLTDTHDVYTRYDFPRGYGTLQPFNNVMAPPWTPWITLKAGAGYMDTVIEIDQTSFADGVSLSDVQVGQVAIIDAEIVRVDGKSSTTLTLARGCYDTIPGPHRAGARLWLFETGAGNDPTAYPLRLSPDGVLGAAVDVKVVPAVYGPPLPLDMVPTDRLDFARRVERPYPPGQVMVSGNRWFMGAIMRKDRGSAIITWVHRNRLTQGSSVVDHLAANRAPEDGTKYELDMSVWVFPKGGDPYRVNLRNVIVDGLSFEYTWAMAQEDGYRAGYALQACGSVTVGMTLTAIRDGFRSWQSYVIPLSLPSYTCPPGNQGGGGQLPGTGGGNGGGGNGSTGGGGGYNPGDGPKDPIDNGGGDNGTGPPPPVIPPIDWPDPVDPPIIVDPEDPNPELAAHWDLNWDRHWDAYNKDNQGD